MGEGDSVASPTQVWIDAQLPTALARWLRTEHGVDTVHVEELGLLRARDPVIFARARSADRSVVIVTKDDDFPKLLGQHGSPPQVVWLRCGNVTNQELRRIVQEAWPRVAGLLGVDRHGMDAAQHGILHARVIARTWVVAADGAGSISRAATDAGALAR